jgi:hypothetical protein
MPSNFSPAVARLMGPNGLVVWLHSVFSGNFMVFYAFSA